MRVNRSFGYFSALAFAVSALSSLGHASAGTPSCSFVYQPGGTFYLAVPGANDSFYAVSILQIQHVDNRGRLLADFNPVLGQNVGITAAARDSTTGDIYLAGALTFNGTPCSALRLKSDGTVISSFSNTTVVNTIADDGGDATIVNGIAPDGTGGCYLGGPFNSVNGQPATGLIHLDATGRFENLSRPNSNSESPLFLESLNGDVLVVQGTVIYKQSVGGSPQVLVSAGDWTSAERVAFDSKYGLAVAGATLAGTKIWVYDTSGNKNPNFQQATAFVEGPSAMAWDCSGRLVLGGARLITSANDPRGVKRLLPNGALDPSWSAALSINGVVAGLAPLAHVVIMSGSFTQVDGMNVPETALLSADDVEGQTANQSAFGRIVGTSEPLVLGLVIKGDYYVDTLIRASGRSLSEFGISPTPASTEFDIYENGTLLTHVNPGSAYGPVYNQSTLVQQVTSTVGAFTLATSGIDEAETVIPLAPGTYTVVIYTTASDSGRVLGEIYFP